MKLVSVFLLVLTLFSTLSFAADHQVWEEKYGDKFVYINGLEPNLFQKYVVAWSRGPAWGQDIYDLATMTGTDFNEWSSYLFEDGYPFDTCGDFTEEDFENIDEHSFGMEWESVKLKKGPKRSVYYLAYFVSWISVGKKSCKIEMSSEAFVFLNPQNKKEDPVYLGRLSYSPKPKEAQ